MDAKSTPQAVKQKSNVVLSPTGLTPENKAANKGKGNDKLDVDENVDKDEELFAREPGEELKTFRKKH